MTNHDTAYFGADPYREMTVLEVTEVLTVVSTFTDWSITRMAEAFDSTFTALFPVLEDQGIQPMGPAFSLHRRMPSDTVDMEVGIPVDRALTAAVTSESGVTLRPSRLPAGRVAIVSHLGSYDGLGEAWGTFMHAVAETGHEPALPFWEIYVTEPSPEADPASMRTDLAVLLG